MENSKLRTPKRAEASPPVKTNAPPVKTNAPPVKTNAPPVKIHAPPVKTNAPSRDDNLRGQATGNQRQQAKPTFRDTVEKKQQEIANEKQSSITHDAKSIAKSLGVDIETAKKLLERGTFDDPPQPEQKQGNEKDEAPKQKSEPQQPPKPPPPPGSPTDMRRPPVYETTQAGIDLQGQDPTLDSHIVASGSFDATPDQLQQFAQMLGLPNSESIENGHQLRLAITESNAQQTLRDVLQKTGYLPPEPEQPGIFGDFRKGFGEGYAKTSGLNLAKRTGGKILDKVADAAIGRLKGRFQAGQYAAVAMKSWDEMTPLERSDYEDEEDYNRQCKSYGKKEVDRLQASGKSEKPGIEMPSKSVDNEDAEEGDQLGLFGEGKKASKNKKFKLENEKEKGKQKLMLDRMDDHPDQQSLFGTFAEAVERYSVDLKKK